MCLCGHKCIHHENLELTKAQLELSSKQKEFENQELLKQKEFDHQQMLKQNEFDHQQMLKQNEFDHQQMLMQKEFENQERIKDLELNLRLELKRKHPECGFSVGSSISLAKISGRETAFYYSNVSSIQKSVSNEAMTAKELSGVLFLECFPY